MDGDTAQQAIWDVLDMDVQAILDVLDTDVPENSQEAWQTAGVQGQTKQDKVARRPQGQVWQVRAAHRPLVRTERVPQAC